MKFFITEEQLIRINENYEQLDENVISDITDKLIKKGVPYIINLLKKVLYKYDKIFVNIIAQLYIRGIFKKSDKSLTEIIDFIKSKNVRAFNLLILILISSGISLSSLNINDDEVKEMIKNTPNDTVSINKEVLPKPIKNALGYYNVDLDKVFNVDPDSISKRVYGETPELKPNSRANKLNPTYKTQNNRGDFNDFIAAFAFRESSNNYEYNPKNKKYLGAFQMNMKNKKFRDEVGKPEFDINQYKKLGTKYWSKNEQVKDFIKNLQNNALVLSTTDYLQKKGLHITDFIGKKINGVLITPSGLLGAAHLVGYKSVVKYLKSNGKRDPMDGNKIRCSEYLEFFNSYQLPEKILDELSGEENVFKKGELPQDVKDKNMKKIKINEKQAKRLLEYNIISERKTKSKRKSAGFPFGYYSLTDGYGTSENADEVNDFGGGDFSGGDAGGE